MPLSPDHSLLHQPYLLPLLRHTECSSHAELDICVYRFAVSPHLCPSFPHLADSGLPSKTQCGEFPGASTAEALGSILGQGTKIPQATWCRQKKKKYAIWTA